METKIAPQTRVTDDSSIKTKGQPTQPSASSEPIVQEYTMTIGKRPKLYDLNKNYTNFEIEFHIQTDDPQSVFYVHILPQDQLEMMDMENLDMKQVTGKISGKVSNTNNIYQNYFIILRNDDPTTTTKIHINTVTHPLPFVQHPDAPSSVTTSPSTPSPMMTEPVETVTETKNGFLQNILNIFLNPQTRLRGILVLSCIIVVIVLLFINRKKILMSLRPHKTVSNTLPDQPTYGDTYGDAYADTRENNSTHLDLDDMIREDPARLFEDTQSPPSPTASSKSSNISGREVNKRLHKLFG